MAVKGVQNLINKINKLSSDIQNECKDIIEFRTGEIEVKAIADAPGAGDQITTQKGSTTQQKIASGRNWTSISQSIGYEISNNGYKGTVFVNRSAGEIAAWVEFSTGQDAKTYLATVEPEWRAEAQKFYINGRGTIIGKPYLYPNYLKQRIEFVNDLKKLLKSKSI